MKNKFLGRTLNPLTLMWEFKDGSGVPIPDELRSQMLTEAADPIGGTIRALETKWKYEEKNRF